MKDSAYYSMFKTAAEGSTKKKIFDAMDEGHFHTDFDECIEKILAHPGSATASEDLYVKANPIYLQGKIILVGDPIVNFKLVRFHNWLLWKVLEMITW